MRRTALLASLAAGCAQQANANRQIFQDGSAVAYPFDTVPPAANNTFYDGVWAKVLMSVITECKTCPYEICSNKNFYPSMFMFRAMCWTNGSTVDDTSMWLRSEEGCFITTKDTYKYQRNYTQDIQFCGEIPLTTKTKQVFTKSLSECRRCPNAKCESVKSYQQKTQIDLVCKAQALGDCLGECDSHAWKSPETGPEYSWSKTNDSCYIKTEEIGDGKEDAKKAQDDKKSKSWPDTFRDWLGGGNSKSSSGGAKNENASQQDLMAGMEDCGPVPYLQRGYREQPPLTKLCENEATKTVLLTSTTTFIMRPPPCATCPPLIFGYAPDATMTMAMQPKTASPDQQEVTSTAPAPRPVQMQPGQPAATPAVPPPKPVEIAPNNAGLAAPAKSGLSPPAPAPVQIAPGKPSKAAGVNTPAVAPMVPVPAPPIPVAATPAQVPPTKAAAPTGVAPAQRTNAAVDSTNAPKQENLKAAIDAQKAHMPVIVPAHVPDFIHETRTTVAEDPALSSLSTKAPMLLTITLTDSNGKPNAASTVLNAPEAPMVTLTKACTCRPPPCGQARDSEDLCSQIAAEMCARKCGSEVPVGGDPFQPLIPGAGRPPPTPAMVRAVPSPEGGS